jgi:hypothetical protein
MSCGGMRRTGTQHDEGIISQNCCQSRKDVRAAVSWTAFKGASSGLPKRSPGPCGALGIIAYAHPAQRDNPGRAGLPLPACQVDSLKVLSPPAIARP